jgi:hypothetical protein
MAIVFQSKINQWALILLFFLFSVALGIAGYYFYENQKNHTKREKFEELRAISDLKVSLIVHHSLIWTIRISSANTVGSRS